MHSTGGILHILELFYKYRKYCRNSTNNSILFSNIINLGFGCVFLQLVKVGIVEHSLSTSGRICILANNTMKTIIAVKYD